MKPTIHFVNPTIESEKTGLKNEKLTIEVLNQAISKQKYIERTKENVSAVYNEIDTNQIFGAHDVEKILGCSATASKDIMKKLRNMKVVVGVKGNGKGKYCFSDESELM